MPGRVPAADALYHVSGSLEPRRPFGLHEAHEGMRLFVCSVLADQAFVVDERYLVPRAFAFGISTSATLLTPLSAIAMLPFGITLMLRTTPPPAGMIQLWNFSVFGSNRTMVFGRIADSLYQIAPRVKTMPYGCDFGPLGDGHSFVGFVEAERPSRF